jgi:uncharacterized membrane protein
MKKAWFWLVLALSAMAVAASMALFVDYVRPAAVFCDEGGGCAALRSTPFARPFGIPTPIFGVSGYLAVALAACLPGRRARIAQALLASLGGMAALFLIYVQVRLQTICPYCAVVDSAGIVVMALSVARVVRGWDPPASRRALYGAGGAIAAALALPLVIGLLRTPQVIEAEVPVAVLEEMRRTPPGKVTVIDFIDFECPFCRATHEELAPLLVEYKDKVRLVRRHVPLRMHPHAMDAARAACCGELLGKGDEMADALASAEPSTLTPEGCEKIAEELGLDLSRFRACVKDPETDARIRKDGEAFRASNGRGLPMLYIDGQRLVGQQDRESLRAALDAAVKRL